VYRPIRRTFVVATAVGGVAICFSLSARSVAAEVVDAKSAAPTACSLLSNADIEKLTGRHFFAAPEPTSLGGGGSACAYGTGKAQVVLFSGSKSEQQYNALLKNYKRENEKKTPVSGIGDKAYIMFPQPKTEYEDKNAILVVRVGEHTVAVSLAAIKPNAGESVQPDVVKLAKAAVAKLR